MTTSKTIAGLIGPTLVAIAAGMLLNIGSFPALAEQVSPCSRPASNECRQGAPKTSSTPCHSHIVGQNQRGAIVLRQKWSRSQPGVRLTNLPPCRIGMEACVGADHLTRTLKGTWS